MYLSTVFGRPSFWAVECRHRRATKTTVGAAMLLLVSSRAARRSFFAPRIVGGQKFNISAFFLALSTADAMRCDAAPPRRNGIDNLVFSRREVNQGCVESARLPASLAGCKLGLTV